MNEESLRRANAFLSKIAEQIQPGESLAATPADIGSQIGLPDPLAAARAVRALLARRRLEMAVDPPGGLVHLDERSAGTAG